MRFKDKSVLITGAASGIGRGAALAFAAEGGKVMVSDLNEEGGNETVARILEAGGQAVFQKTDVADYDSVAALVEGTVGAFGSLDIAVNNAGIGGDRAVSSRYSQRAWDKVIAVNQTGVFYCMQHELRQMEKQGSGAIVNIASIAGLKGFPLQLGYTASKHAVVGMTKTAALEYARANIRINGVCPVFTSTPMVDELLGFQPDLEAKLLKTIPMRRFGTVEDIVNAILWLCDEHSGFITGLNLPVDGGQMA